MSEEYTLFTGCSYTHGDGFDKLRDDENLWVNLIHNRHPFLKNTKKINDSMGGRGNHNIFTRTIYNLTHYNIKYAFIQWTSIPRIEFEIGLETYSTRQVFIPNVRCTNHNLNDITYEGKYLEKIRDRVTSIMHDNYEIVKLLEYVNSIVRICKMTDTRVFFINGLCPWDDNYFTQLHSVFPKEYTDYTQQLINVNNRSDVEIMKIYKKMHTTYDGIGGIHNHRWINLYNSLQNHKLDVNNDKIHPGTISNKQTYKIVSQAIDRRHLNQSINK